MHVRLDVVASFGAEDGPCCHQIGISPENHPRVVDPVPIKEMSWVGAVADIAAGEGHSVIACPDGEVWCWGDNRCDE